jgi:hypothetical protein
MNTEMYALLNPDLRRVGIVSRNQLEHHYNKRGRREHRPITFRQKFPKFNHQQYRKNYPDIQHLNDYELEIHFLTVGRKQHRTYSTVHLSSSSVSNKPDANPHISIFTHIYQNEIWGKSTHSEFRGTPGELSHFDFISGSYSPFLRKFIEKNKISSVVDVGCGNFDWARSIFENLSIRYHGYDAYNEIILYNKNQHPDFNFTHLDAYSQRDKLEPADLLILKDVLPHWSNHEITTFLNHMIRHKPYKVILMVNCNNQTSNESDISTGGFRHLDSSHYPLNQYKIQKIYQLGMKEISLLFT